MYAIIEHAGHQYRVEKGAEVVVNRLDAKVGDAVTLGPVLLLGGENVVAAPTALKGASVSGKVVAHTRGVRQEAMKYKPKKQYRRRVGGRSHLTRVEITDIVVP